MQKIKKAEPNVWQRRSKRQGRQKWRGRRRQWKRQWRRGRKQSDIVAVAEKKKAAKQKKGAERKMQMQSRSRR